MGTSRENAPEKVVWVDEQSGVQPSQELIKDRPCLLHPRLGSCFHTHSSSRGRSEEDLSPLLHENAELKAEQSSLLLKNSELVSRTLLLKLENQRLKEQLELQLRKAHIASSSSASLSGSSSLSEEDLSDSDNEEFMSHAVKAGFSKVKHAPARDDTHSP